MAAAWKLIFALCSIASILLFPKASATGVHEAADGWLTTPAMGSGCRGTVAECLMENGDDEFQLDSESNRRILATRRYISYGALRKNSVPCSRRGHSYYGCNHPGPARPYRRGCNRITRCRS